MKTNYENLPAQVDLIISELAIIKSVLFEPIKKEEEVPKFLNLSGALELLKHNGSPMSKSKLYKLTSSNKIPYHKCGSRLVFMCDELIYWAEEQRQEIKYSVYDNLIIKQIKKK